jgi:hypothetical protein
MKALLLCGLVLGGLMGSAAARADGLADMKAALARASSAAPVRAVAETRAWRKRGEGAEADEDRGQASVAIEDGARGMVVTHGRELLGRIDAEQRARAKNPNSKTPTLFALEDLDVQELTALASAGPALLRKVERGVYKGEGSDTLQGKSVRVLRFEMPISTLSARDRKYAKQFKALLEVWIGADGMPLASRLHQTGSGRAFVVVSFDTALDEDCVYALAGERLVTVKKEVRSRASGAGEQEERKVVTTLEISSGSP